LRFSGTFPSSQRSYETKDILPNRPRPKQARILKNREIGRIYVFHPAGLRLETTGTTGKNNERTPKESCFKQLFPIIKKLCGEMRKCAREIQQPKHFLFYTRAGICTWVKCANAPDYRNGNKWG